MLIWFHVPSKLRQACSTQIEEEGYLVLSSGGRTHTAFQDRADDVHEPRQLALQELYLQLVLTIPCMDIPLLMLCYFQGKLTLCYL